MKLKPKSINSYSDYENDGWFIEGVSTPEEAAKVMNEEYRHEDQAVYTAEDTELKTLHNCLDCDMQWCHDGDYVCGECGEPRLSKKYIEVYYFTKRCE